MQHLDEEQLTAYLDGQPTADERMSGWADTKAHLQECAECQERLESIRVTRERAQAILRSGTPSGAQPSFQDVLKRRQAAKAQARSLASLRPLAWAASIVLALSLGWYTRELQLRPSAPATVELSATESAGPAVVADASRQVATQPPPPVIRAQEERPRVATRVLRRRENEAAGPPADARLKKLDTAQLALNAVEVKEEIVATAVGAAARAPETDRLSARRALAQPAAGRPAAPRAARAPANVPGRADDAVRVDLSEATRVLGRAPLTVPGMEVLEYQVIPRQPAVRVTQRMQTGTLEMIQQIAGAGVDLGQSASRTTTGPGVGGLVEGIQLRLWGPVSYDSLRALVGKLQ